MQREQSGNRGAPPDRTRVLYSLSLPSQAREQEEKQDRVRDVEQQAGEVMPTRVKSEELGVQHVGEPRQRMPVARKAGLEGPGDALPAKPVHHAKVRADVGGIIVIDKIASGHRPKCRQRHRSQGRANPQLAACLPRQVHGLPV